MAISKGSKVSVQVLVRGKHHVGTVEELRPSKTAPDIMVAYVRWHRGFASWHTVSDLVEVEATP